MLSSTFDFFVDLGGKVSIFGMNLWDLSLLAFVFALVGRFLFPFLFAESGSLFVRKSGSADTVDDSKLTEGQKSGNVSSTYYQQKGGVGGKR